MPTHNYSHFDAHRRTCGLYYYYPRAVLGGSDLLCLPLVDIQAHASILSSTSRTVLTQTFMNPSKTKGIKELRYLFPLHEGVSVVGFTCRVRGRTIVGQVKEREKAKAVFNDAVARGEAAGLFEQLKESSDVFITTLGNIPPGERVVVTLTYLGELKHDMSVDGIRYTIPTHICPRYGVVGLGVEGEKAQKAVARGISITVDVEVADGSSIQKIQSPSHPIAVSMGTTSTTPNGNPSMSKATASLSLEQTSLDTDFILQIVAKETGIPRAILETHLTIPNQRALMVTLVPKFALPPEKPEIVFMVDRSGSMSGTSIQLTIQALRVFLKSLPVGVKFNICSFGSHYSFLWTQSQTYNQETLESALSHVESMDANYGGTEMLQPLEAAIKNRYGDIPLDIMLLTDGQVWNQQSLFSSLTRRMSEAKMPMRIFTLGIGNGVSLALVEGIARAGNGFSQTVADGEKMDSKVVRMLKGALSPHVNDYTLEVKYSEESNVQEFEGDVEVIEKVSNALRINLDLKDTGKKEVHKQTISLYDESIDPDNEETPAGDHTGESKYAHLPDIPVPKIIQAPQNIPPLFAFNRTTVYLLFGSKAVRMPKSVLLRGTSQHGPLELEIPVQVLDTPGETIHQLAAKKAIGELEESRGWLPDAKDAKSGKLVKDQYPSRFSDMVEREAVRLGVQFQVGGKWCSFVAVERKDRKADEEMNEDWEWLDVVHTPPASDDGETESDLTVVKKKKAAIRQINRIVERGEHMSSLRSTSDQIAAEAWDFASSRRSLPATTTVNALRCSLGPSPQPRSRQLKSSAQPRMAMGASSVAQQGSYGQSAADLSLFGDASGGTPLFGRAPVSHNSSFTYSATTAPPPPPGPAPSLFYRAGAAPSAPPPAPAPGGGGLFGQEINRAIGSAPSPLAPSKSLFGSGAPPPPGSSPIGGFSTGATPFGRGAPPGATISPASCSFGTAAPPKASTGSSPLSGSVGGIQLFGRLAAPTNTQPIPAATLTLDEVLDRIIALQSFEGYWQDSPELLSLLGVAQTTIARFRSKVNADGKKLATALVLAFLGKSLKSKKEVWELVGEKARGWLEGQGEGDVDGLVGKVGSVLEDDASEDDGWE